MQTQLTILADNIFAARELCQLAEKRMIRLNHFVVAAATANSHFLGLPEVMLDFRATINTINLAVRQAELDIDDVEAAMEMRTAMRQAKLMLKGLQDSWAKQGHLICDDSQLNTLGACHELMRDALGTLA